MNPGASNQDFRVYKPEFSQKPHSFEKSPKNDEKIEKIEKSPRDYKKRYTVPVTINRDMPPFAVKCRPQDYDIRYTGVVLKQPHWLSGMIEKLFS